MDASELTISRPPLVEVLLESDKLTPEDANKVDHLRSQKGIPLEEVLVEVAKVSPAEIAEIYAERFHVPLRSPLFPGGEPDLDLNSLLPEKFARDNRCIPVEREKRWLHVAVADPTDPYLLQETRLYTGLMVTSSVAPYDEIAMALSRLYGGTRDLVRELASEADDEETTEAATDEEEEKVVDLDSPIGGGKDNQVLKIGNFILSSAITERASDVHLEQYPDEVKVRFRIDGNLQDMTPPPKSFFIPLLSRFKILAKMDIAEKRIPQDGSFTTLLNGVDIDWRVNTVPTVFGEKMVMRVLNKSAMPTDLPGLGFAERQLEDFEEAANAPHGLIFVTGPTGSGKSTTLYATLNLLRSPKTNIMTVEDPVEYKFPGIAQVQTKASIGLNFASVLRAFLRQDPDVIMVGEVRDQETAQICLRAALTGHLVLSTLHTNDALSSVDRLVDMGIEPFLVASTLRLIEAQRLVRRICADCKEPYEPSPELIERHELPEGATLYRGAGCDKCRDTGYRGRVGVFEVVRITDKLADMIGSEQPMSEIRQRAREEGMASLFNDGLSKALAGLTSLEEVIKTTLTGED